ncbi:ester cyclase [Ktedonobacter robiniae]|uniref:SnoaL-like domain-containing protein n=1 Tax=Ktedonobacter robiniae TaxID=2778365 RepID=A0ABQ3UTJ2_9CHLR|nr:nuclear transport factor 2 family protein [Ktedonobacter robiniae]GHO56149.1 hypothetical protein KSB_46240 [Ktedonobacter robiniae]
MGQQDCVGFTHRAYEAINSRNVAALEEVFVPHIIRHAAGETGIKSVKKAVASAFTTFPEKRFIVEDVLVEDNKAALRVTIQGISTAPGQPLPTILEIFRVENGQVVEVWGAGTSRRPGA